MPPNRPWKHPFEGLWSAAGRLRKDWACGPPGQTPVQPPPPPPTPPGAHCACDSPLRTRDLSPDGGMVGFPSDGPRRRWSAPRRVRRASRGNVQYDPRADGGHDTSSQTRRGRPCDAGRRGEPRELQPPGQPLEPPETLRHTNSTNKRPPPPLPPPLPLSKQRSRAQPVQQQRPMCGHAAVGSYINDGRRPPEWLWHTTAHVKQNRRNTRIGQHGAGVWTGGRGRGGGGSI